MPGPHRIDMMTGAWVGRGEDLLVEILDELFKGEPHDIETHVKVLKLMPPIYMSFPWGERQQKETVDIILHLFAQNKIIIIRVQDARHRGQGLAREDARQAKDLFDLGCLIIDFHEDENPHIFKGIMSDKAVAEVKAQFNFIGVIPLDASDW